MRKTTPLVDSRLKNLQYGLHSKIPKCCIDYFLNIWKIKQSEFKDKRMQSSVGWNYIPCDKCLFADNKVEIHACGIECMGYLINEIEFEPKTAYKIVYSNMMMGNVPLPNGKFMTKKICYVAEFEV